MKDLGDSCDVQSLKQVPMHPRDKLVSATKKAQDDDVQFIEQVPSHPRDRLERKTKNLKHPRDRMKEKELKIARKNVSTLMQGKCIFNPERFLNKTVIFDTSKSDEEQITDRILENIPGNNDDIFLTHELGTNSFSLRHEDGT